MGGFFWGDYSWYWLTLFAVSMIAIGYSGLSISIWTGLLAFGFLGLGAPIWAWICFGIIALLFNIKSLRKTIISSALLKAFKTFKLVPAISETERTALEAGIVWVEGDLFSGKPDFKKILSESYPELSEEEKNFLNGPVEKVCQMVDDWQVWQTRELPQEIFEYIKKEKFLGMIIPKKYGGLEFSPLGNSAVICKVSSRCLPLATTIMVPNSLGPAELLLHYGTEAQKNDLLPKLARGEHIPCFALTEPNAGSDAGGMEAEGVVFKDADGEIKIRLNWNKRWITLAAISTLQGIAFKLKDPENLLGRGVQLGITCALVPSETPGVQLGLRHDPLGVPFFNCPSRGHNVVISINQIVGEMDGIGHGWKMLMECLAAGRGISLPAQSTCGAKMTTRVVSAHALIRKQFGVSIGQFEGVEEPLGRIGGLTYLLEAMRKFTCGALNKGVKPPVITAIAKYYSTEISRKLINDGMDIMGGSGISLGPRNLIAHSYIGAPIAITVEGANILTRTLIIFGQGALRAHPYAFKEVAAVEKNDLNGFDDAFFGHIGHVVRNLFRSFVLSITRAYFVSTPSHGKIKRYYQKLSWTSATFALMADIAMGSLGGSLKMKEKLTGRFADILSWMYMGTAVLKRFESEGARKEDLPMVHYAMSFVLNEIQMAFDGIFANLNVPGLTWFFNGPIRLWSRMNLIGSAVKDNYSHEISSALMKGGEPRERWTEGIFVPTDATEALGRLEKTFKTIKLAEPIDKKIRVAIRTKQLPKKKIVDLLDLAVEKNIISNEEKDIISLSEKLRYDAIQVDEFTLSDYLNRENKPKSYQNKQGAHTIHAI